jgi:urease accessory protein
MATVAALLLADGRFPAGGHAHSGGLEAAVADGRAHDVASLASFVEGRLATAGRVAAGLAAAACSRRWPVELLDAEADARMSSPALRRASRVQGRQLLRAAAHAWPVAVAVDLSSPHHAVAVGVVSAAAGLGVADAGRWAAYDAAMAPATAGVRLLGLDPFSVAAVVAGLSSAIDEVAAEAAAWVAAATAHPSELPSQAAPMLDLGAEAHAVEEVRLFAS